MNLVFARINAQSEWYDSFVHITVSTSALKQGTMRYSECTTSCNEVPTYLEPNVLQIHMYGLIPHN